MKRIGLLLFSVFILAGCNQRPVFKEARSFNNAVWNRFGVQSYQIEKITVGEQYDIFITLDCIPSKMNEKGLWANLTFFSPEDEMRAMDVNLKMFDNSGNPTVEVKDDKAVYRVQVITGISFSSPGPYRFEVMPVSSKYDITGIEGITVEMFKHKKRE